MNTEPTFIPQGHYFTIQEVVNLKGVERRTVQKWVDKKWVISVKTGIGHLILAESLENFQPPKRGPKSKI